MRRIAILAACTLICCGIGDPGVLAQDEAPSATAKETEARRGPLPFYYGKLGMSDEQREAAYDVMDAYDTKIEALKQQMKALMQEREEKLKATLTPGQKLRLQELLEAARKKAGATKEAGSTDEGN